MSQAVEDEITKDNIGSLIIEFAEAVKACGKVEDGEKTMYDVLKRANEAVQAGNIPTSVALQQFAEDTKDMEATKGRAAYFKENQKASST